MSNTGSLQVFKSFPDRGAAEDFALVLREYQIVYEIAEDALMFDPSYSFNGYNKEYQILLSPSSFQKATEAYEEYFKPQLDSVDADYYLFAFTDSELLSILEEPDAWGTFDYLLAQKLLKDRGVEVSETDRAKLKEKRYETLKLPREERASTVLLYFVLTVLFYPIGIVIGWVWGYSRKTLPDGRRVSSYTKSVQVYGLRLFFLGWLLFVLSILNVFTPLKSLFHWTFLY